MQKMTIKQRKLSDLKPMPGNPRQHTAEQVDLICSSMRQWGWTMPVLIDEQDRIIAGHARCMAAQQLKLDQVPTILVKGWTEDQIKAYVIADNKLTERSSWDVALLANDFSELIEAGFDALLTGFSQGEIDYLVDGGTDPGKEWEGMPGFESEDHLAYQTIKVHLVDAKARHDFGKLLKQKLTEETKYVWFPEQEREGTTDKRVTSSS